ncbi:MAG: ParA family protein [Phycisphaeraceae bacterium]|nr:MAG: ParA family protein [Phycisphaeraceae bacterium]
MSTRPVRLIALMNQKGGVGKTTTTVNLAAAFARAGRRTLVVDLDPQAHASLHLGVDSATLERSVYDLLLDPSLDAGGIIRRATENLDVLPSTTDLAAAEIDLAAEPDRLKRLEAIFAALGDRYDHILIDCPPSLGLLTLNGLAAAREVIIPMQAHFLALQGVGKLMETVRLASRSFNPRLRVLGVVLCMHDPTSTHAREVVADLEGFFEAGRDQDTPWRYARVLRPPVRRNIKLAECPSFGQTIFDYAPDAPGAQDYAAIAEGLTREWDALVAKLASAASPAPTHAQVSTPGRQAPVASPGAEASA